MILGKIWESKYRVLIMFALIFGILELCAFVGFFLVPTSKKSKEAIDDDYWLDDDDIEDIEDDINIDE